jgi:hypothetical protein
MKFISRLFLILTIVCSNIIVLAQPGNPGGDPDIPIDGGTSLLLAAGALFGIKKIYDLQKKKK